MQSCLSTNQRESMEENLCKFCGFWGSQFIEVGTSLRNLLAKLYWVCVNGVMGEKDTIEMYCQCIDEINCPRKFCPT